MGSETISDLSIAAPSDALSETPLPNKWLILPYQGDEVAGKMLWCPSRSQPPDVAIPLPPLGLCRIYIGLYGSGTVPIYWEDSLPITERAASFYEAGADGLNVSPNVPEKSQAAVLSRLGHTEELRQLDARARDAARLVRISIVSGLRFDLHFGTATCG